MKTPHELAQRYPYMFAGKNLGNAVARGWLPLFSKLCEQIDTLLGDDKMGFHWVQCKEKFGSARFYWKTDRHSGVRVDLFGDDGVLSLATKAADVKLSEIQGLVTAAERETQKVCIVCGLAPAKASAEGGHYLVLCEAHALARQRGTEHLPSPWFEAAENLP